MQFDFRAAQPARDSVPAQIYAVFFAIGGAIFVSFTGEGIASGRPTLKYVKPFRAISFRRKEISPIDNDWVSQCLLHSLKVQTSQTLPSP